MTIELRDDYILFVNKISKSTTTMKGKTYEKYMVYFPNVLYEYLGKPQQIHLKNDGGKIYVSTTKSVGSVPKQLYKVGENNQTNMFILPKVWVGNHSPTIVNYIFDFGTKDITFKIY